MLKLRKRKYKECEVQDTIAKLLIILNKFDILPRETFYSNPFPQIHSMRVELEKQHGGFGANGKGRTREYCCASAYAEFLERLQNDFFARYSRTIINHIQELHGFYYWPDEEYLDKEGFLSLPDAIIEDLILYSGASKYDFIDSYFCRLKENGMPGIISVPFFDTLKRQEIFLPINLLYSTIGTNGMSAGNTNSESIFQALCEILERWAASEIYYNRLTPPTIPNEFLRQFIEEYKIIQEIERNKKYKVIVKDFSAQRRIPALGLIIIDENSNSYRLNVGSDTSFQVALSRCLTEIFQGVSDEKNFDNNLISVPKTELECFINNDGFSHVKRFNNFCMFTKNGSGSFPPSLFSDKEDYFFDPEVFTEKESFEEEVKTLVDYFHREGYNVYIRDTGYLGFPAISIYVPQLSSVGRKNVSIDRKSKTFGRIELDKVEASFFDLKTQPKSILRKIAVTLENIEGNPNVYDLFNVTVPEMANFRIVNKFFFLTILWYSLNEIGNSLKALRKFIESQNEYHPYYDVVEKYLALRIKGLRGKCLEEKLLLLVHESERDLVQEVLDDMSNPEKALGSLRLPICPKCQQCPISKECLTRNRIKLSIKLYHEKKLRMIDQRKLARIIGE